jgi:hypothetical protein
MAMDGDATESVDNAHLPSEDVERVRVANQTIAVLPVRRADDTTGVYAKWPVFLATDLRAHGVGAAFVDASANRMFEAKHGVLDTSTSLPPIGGRVGDMASKGTASKPSSRAFDEVTAPLAATRTRTVVSKLSSPTWTRRGSARFAELPLVSRT